jgi:hypothetical protein
MVGDFLFFFSPFLFLFLLPLVSSSLRPHHTYSDPGNIFTYGKMDTNFHVLVGFHKSMALSLPEQYPGNLQSLTTAQIHPEDAASMFFDFKDSSQLFPTVAPAVEA